LYKTHFNIIIFSVPRSPKSCRSLKFTEHSHGATVPSVKGHPNCRGFMITLNDAPQSIRLLSTSDQLLVETCTWQHTTLTTDRRPCPRCDSNPQSQKASSRRPTP